MLSWSNFIMFSFSRNSKLPKFFIKFFHEIRNSFFNSSKIMIF